ncbi:hypothetical protein ACD591_11445 [Rufibacter glacialis]|uniref:Uncharacterized protein n=1 Tax=Rufibacter glacialis TaxID=1259555 RepID=A0A5M8Q8W8_9BACT|nr:hypothetical protein [Rufibacter glacialis]KAA6431633.1 hypothetical protein FOE74_16045 [Rufibacter glacialis]GGK82803.1 hypothetical protein GCM10011405_33270 [Rufibacter glacialis]
MALKLLTAINWFLILLMSGTLGFLSFALFLGTKEGKQKLLLEPITSFLERFLAFGLLGIIGAGVLVLVNLLINRAFLDSEISLKDLAIRSTTIVLGACFIGTLAFLIL